MRMKAAMCMDKLGHVLDGIKCRSDKKCKHAEDGYAGYDDPDDTNGLMLHNDIRLDTFELRILSNVRIMY